MSYIFKKPKQLQITAKEAYIDMLNPAKTLLLCAACALPCAHAQSGSVNLSGFIDIGIHRNLEKTWIMSPIQRSSLTLSGREELGTGYAATFTLTTRYEPDSGRMEDAGSKPFFHGQSTVGLAGGFGRVQLGRRLDAVYNNDWHYDPWYYNDRVASPAWDTWHYLYPSDPQANNGAADFGRLNNGIFYDSPPMRGVSLHLSASAEKRDGDRRRPLAAALVWQKAAWQAMAARASNSAGHSDRFFGLRAPAGPLTLMGVYNISQAAAQRAKTAALGAAWPMGQTTLKAGWSRVTVNGSRAARILGLGAHHALSKRTALYVSLGHKKFTPQAARTLYGMGVSHAF